ncbi:MAG: transketolase family protein [Candidatus Aminicenantaceae bacterium]
MRVNFFRALQDLAKERKNIILLTGDLGFKLFDSFRSQYPDRFYNVGVAESNMIGIAAGLSLSGKNVYCYSIIPFLIMRTFEHIRIDLAYNNLKVKLVGAGGGFTYGLEGYTHFGLEDLALMRSLPNMTVVVPADPQEAISLAKASVEYDGPIYIRLGKTGEPFIHEKPIEFRIGRSIILSEGKDIAIFAIGSMVYPLIATVELLKKAGFNATLINMHTLKPLDKAIIEQVSSSHSFIFTVEEHYVNGGLGSAVAEVLAESGFNGSFRRIGIPNDLGKYIGKSDYLKGKYGLTTEGVYKKIIECVEEV